MNPTILGVMGPGFLNQVPTLDFPGLDFGAKGILPIWMHAEDGPLPF